MILKLTDLLHKGVYKSDKIKFELDKDHMVIYFNPDDKELYFAEGEEALEIINNYKLEKK